MNINSSLLLKEELLKEVGARFNLLSEEDVYAAVGYGGITANQVIGRLREEYRKKFGEEKTVLIPQKERKRKRIDRSTRGVHVHGLDNLLVRFARCCNPVPGDLIVGFVTRGRGVSVHRRDCINLRQETEKPNRFLDVSWEENPDIAYSVEVEISADRPHILSEIISSVSEDKVNITAVNSRTDKNKVTTINLTLVVRDVEHLQQVMNRIKKIRDVFSVRRYMSK